MKVLSSTAAILALLVPLPTAARSIFDSSQTPLQSTDVFPVKGDNPLLHCANPADDILQIDSVDLIPNPPVAYV